MSRYMESLKLTPQDLRTGSVAQKNLGVSPPSLEGRERHVTLCKGSETQTEVQTVWVRGWTSVGD